MDIIYISELKTEANIGLDAWEKPFSQVIEINLEIEIPSRKPGETDNISDTINYATVTDRIRKELAIRRFGLLEALAEFVANLLLHDFGATWTKVDVAKTGM
jgi:dihydroneopterin aldolase